MTPMEFLDEKALCQWLGISAATAQAWRSQSKGPAYFKIGRGVRYNRADVEAWVNDQRVITGDCV